MGHPTTSCELSRRDILSFHRGMLLCGTTANGTGRLNRTKGSMAMSDFHSHDVCMYFLHQSNNV